MTEPHRHGDDGFPTPTGDDMECNEAHLGLATTRQLLDEIRARGETEPAYREWGDNMAMGAVNLMDQLPGSMLEYRTVDEEVVNATERPEDTVRRYALRLDKLDRIVKSRRWLSPDELEHIRWILDGVEDGE